MNCESLISPASFPGSLGTGRREPWERDWNRWRIQGRGPGGSAPPLFLDQTEARRAEKFFDATPSLSHGLDDRPPTPTLI